MGTETMRVIKGLAVNAFKNKLEIEATAVSGQQPQVIAFESLE